MPCRIVPARAAAHGIDLVEPEILEKVHRTQVGRHITRAFPGHIDHAIQCLGELLQVLIDMRHREMRAVGFQMTDNITQGMMKTIASIARGG